MDQADGPPRVSVRHFEINVNGWSLQSFYSLDTCLKPVHYHASQLALIGILRNNLGDPATLYNPLLSPDKRRGERSCVAARKHGHLK